MRPPGHPESEKTETAESGSFGDHQPALIVVTGIMAAGKSTVAHLLAQTFARGAHVEADVLQRMIVSGGMWVGQAGDPAGEAAAQLRLRLHNMCVLARSFFSAGFSVVLDDIIIGERWQELQEELEGLPVSLVVLAPSVDVVAGLRDLQRSKAPQGREWAEHLDQALHSTMAGVGLWIDNSRQAPEQTVDEIRSKLGGANLL